MTDFDRLRERSESKPDTIEPQALACSLQASPSRAITIGEILSDLNESKNGSMAVSEVASLLKDADSKVRSGAALALATYFADDPEIEASDPLKNTLISLLNDDYSVARKHAGIAVLAITCRQPRAAVAATDHVPTLLDPDSLSLLGLGSELASKIVDVDPDTAIALLNPMLDTLIKTAGRDYGDGPISEPSVGRTDFHGVYEDRAHASRTLNHHRNRIAETARDLVVSRPAAGGHELESVLEVIETVESGSIRAPLIVALGRVAEEDPDAAVSAIDILAEQLNDDDPAVTAISIWALGIIADTAPRAVANATVDHIDALAAQLDAEESGVRAASAGLLAYVGEYHSNEANGAVDALATHLDDDESNVRGSAALALGYIGSTDALDSLRESMDDDPSMRVRETAREAIESVQNEASKE